MQLQETLQHTYSSVSGTRERSGDLGGREKDLE